MSYDIVDGYSCVEKNTSYPRISVQKAGANHLHGQETDIGIKPPYCNVMEGTSRPRSPEQR